MFCCNSYRPWKNPKGKMSPEFATHSDFPCFYLPLVDGDAVPESRTSSLQCFWTIWWPWRLCVAWSFQLVFKKIQSPWMQLLKEQVVRFYGFWVLHVFITYGGCKNHQKQCYLGLLQNYDIARSFPKSRNTLACFAIQSAIQVLISVSECLFWTLYLPASSIIIKSFVTLCGVVSNHFCEVNGVPYNSWNVSRPSLRLACSACSFDPSRTVALQGS